MNYDLCYQSEKGNNIYNEENFLREYQNQIIEVENLKKHLEDKLKHKETSLSKGVILIDSKYDLINHMSSSIIEISKLLEK